MNQQSLEHTVSHAGGTEADRDEVLRVHGAFWTANNTLDIPAVEPHWGDVLFFNSNGSVYHGVEEWKQVWRYYGAHFETTVPAELSATSVLISGDIAVVCDEGVRRGWRAVGVDDVSAGIATDQRVRSTMVLERAGDSWRIVHAHFSPRGEGQRPAFPDE